MNTKVILYSTGCPKCNVLKQKLDMAGIDYEVETDMSTLIDLGIDTVPILKVDNDYKSFKVANDWINENRGRQ